MKIEDLSDHVAHFRARVLQDALAEGTRTYWLRRAAVFEAARPQPGDFTGRATRAELSVKWRELTAVAQACRARAETSLRMGPPVELDIVLDELRGAA